MDGGTSFPNLALMKLSGWNKANGNAVELIDTYSCVDMARFDEVYLSKVFDYTNIPEDILRMENMHIGGTGFYFDNAPSLPFEIEHHMPDYTLYDKYIKENPSLRTGIVEAYTNYSIGFSTRGCFRKCDFCVNKKYDHAMFHSHIKEWLDDSREYICLLDDNVLAYSKWKDIFNEINETGKRYVFKQGLDIRLMTDEKADVISKSKYHKDGFIFAFDNIKDKELIESKLTLWRRHTDKKTRMYVLCGYYGTDENEVESAFERIKILINYRCYPYIMRHKNYTKSKYAALFTSMAAWCNQPAVFNKKSFREFNEAKQAERKGTKLTPGMVAMIEFEKEYPSIAKKYFDMKW